MRDKSFYNVYKVVRSNQIIDTISFFICSLILGALVVFTAIYLCDEVTIYGFGYDPRFTMHYYDTDFVKHTDESTGSHDVKNERELWYKLHTEGVIKLFKRDF